ncbi:MAG: Rne/Rng family ribonuclease [Rhizobiaceae bacterium]|nr:Rne/Rng family ribonuclease [Rhizobiaceae bacterium]
MLIDASHEEETRVVVVRGNRIEEFDFESQHKKQLRGNIYLAKVTRVEPSLQAAFVDYGGNRHGFLAFSEIHPDYYQIPLADRQALLEAEAAEAAAADNDEDTTETSPSDVEAKTEIADEDKAPEDTVAADAETEEKPKPKKRRTRRKKAEPVAEAESGKETSGEDVDTAAQAAIESPSEPAETESGPSEATENADPEAEQSSTDDVKPDDKPDTMAAMVETDDEISEPAPEPSDEEPTASNGEEKQKDTATASTTDSEVEATASEETETTAEATSDETQESVNSDETSEEAEEKPKKRRRSRSRKAKKAEPEAIEADTSDADDEDDGNVENIGSDDALEEVPVAPRKTRKQYRIQEVIKRRQILLVQIVKEERGNKGAALTTYMSLAGRYSVLMPNTARGGGISRKITNVQDRKRLKEVARELEVPQGMGVILRTAGASRTKTEIRRDFEYLMRLWENVRNLTLNSTAPCLVYEEGSLIKRSVRDLYNKDIGEVIVSGEEGYREAKDFMKMLMPSHAKVVQPYRGTRPIFVNNGIEAQLDQMMSPQVTLKSGGYLIINQTEALVAVDVNSGRSTRESSIEDTALATNLEAAEEVSRQLRLRDLAGLVVIDFIDMEEKRNNRAVEKRLKDCLKHDRARIQVGRISHFGLLEMSRQRIRASVLESTTAVCPHCEGRGHVRSDSSLALHVLRGIEEQLLKAPRNDVNVRSSSDIALYILNQKRDTLTELEERFGVTISFNVDATISGQDFFVEKGPISTKTAKVDPEQSAVSSYGEADSEMMDTSDEVSLDHHNADNDDEEQPRKKRRRRRRRGRGNSQDNQNNGSENENSDQEQTSQVSENEDADGVEGANEQQLSDDEEARPKKRRRRGKRGGRKNREREENAAEASNSEGVLETVGSNDTDEIVTETASEETQSPEPAAEPEQVVESSASDDTEEKPKKPRRRRTKKTTNDDAIETLKETAPEPDVASSTMAAAATSDETQETPKANRESRTNLDAIASEPVLTSTQAGDEPTDPSTKKTGWWRRAFK